MIALVISDTSLEYVEMKHSLSGRYSLTGPTRVELTPSASWQTAVAQLPHPSQIALAIPDSQAYVRRIEVTGGDSAKKQQEILEKIASVIPYQHNELVVNTTTLYIHPTSGRELVLVCASPKLIIAEYQGLLERAGHKVVSIVPESLAIHQLVREEIGNGQVALVADVRSRRLTFSFFDAVGPYVTFSQEAVADIAPLTRRIIDFFKAQYLLPTSKVFLSGGGSANANLQTLSTAIGIPVVPIAPILDKKLTHLSLDFAADQGTKIYFANAIGAGLAALQKAPISLVASRVESQKPLVPKGTASPPTKPRRSIPLVVFLIFVILASAGSLVFFLFLRN